MLYTMASVGCWWFFSLDPPVVATVVLQVVIGILLNADRFFCCLSGSCAVLMYV